MNPAPSFTKYVADLLSADDKKAFEKISDITKSVESYAKQLHDILNLSEPVKTKIASLEKEIHDGAGVNKFEELVTARTRLASIERALDGSIGHVIRSWNTQHRLGFINTPGAEGGCRQALEILRKRVSAEIDRVHADEEKRAFVAGLAVHTESPLEVKLREFLARVREASENIERFGFSGWEVSDRNAWIGNQQLFTEMLEAIRPQS